MGGDDGNYLSRVEILDTTELRQWYCAASLPQTLCCVLPAIIGNMCYLLGGYTKGGVPSKKVFSVCLDDLIPKAVSEPANASVPSTPTPWQSLPDTPVECSSGLAFNGALLSVGGQQAVGGLYTYPWASSIYHYQPSSRRWVKAGELPDRQVACTCTVLSSGELYIAGGIGGLQQVDIITIQ